MLDWARKHAPGSRVGALEGTGSFAAGLAGKLALTGEDVVEVGALRRARGSKNDRLDAVRAGRTAMAREHQSSPRVRGLREAIRSLAATRQGVLVSRTKAITELKRSHPNCCGRYCAAARCQPAGIDRRSGHHRGRRGRRITVLTLRSITARIRFLTGQLADIDPDLARLIQAHPPGPALLAEPGVGAVVAAQLLVSWSHPGRVRSEAAVPSLAGVAPLEASSGQRTRHRLDRGGDRAPNRVLHAVAITRLRCHAKPGPTKARRPLQGKTHRDV
ncbi:MAG: hypothetical protein JWN05_3418, partial [Arthrobacter sp.]|nr:hypothetical protein [Arthrobacter sp.]